MTCAFLLLAAVQGKTVQLKADGSTAENNVTISVHQRPTEDGGKFIEMRVDLKKLKSNASVRRQSTFDPQMRCKRIVQEVIGVDGARSSVIVSISETGAQVVEMGPKGRKSRVVPLPKQARTAAPSDFWFWKLHPKIGDKCSYFGFNTESLEWEIVDVTYSGDVKIGGMTVHRVESDQGGRKSVALLDDDGLPVKLEANGTTYSRS